MAPVSQWLSNYAGDDQAWTKATSPWSKATRRSYVRVIDADAVSSTVSPGDTILVANDYQSLCGPSTRGGDVTGFFRHREEPSRRSDPESFDGTDWIASLPLAMTITSDAWQKTPGCAARRGRRLPCRSWRVRRS